MKPNMPNGVGKFNVSRWKRVLLAAIAFLTVCALAVFNAIVPFRMLLPAYAVPRRDGGELRVHFLGVGQGDCTVIEFPDGGLVVVDAGDGSWNAENHIIRYLKGLGGDVRAVIATHADSDHCGGIPELLRAFGADRAYLPVLGSGTAAYKAAEQAAVGAGCEISALSRYDVLEGAGGAFFVCLSPYSEGETDENDASVVLWGGMAGVEFLLCGDITSSREARLLAEYGLSGDIFDAGGHAVRLEETEILKVAHHGSASSSSQAWLDLIGAEEAIVSCGRGNSYGHPSAEALARVSAAGGEIWRVDELGDVVVTVSPEGEYSVRSYFFS